MPSSFHGVLVSTNTHYFGLPFDLKLFFRKLVSTFLRSFPFASRVAFELFFSPKGLFSFRLMTPWSLFCGSFGLLSFFRQVLFPRSHQKKILSGEAVLIIR